jgi:hypothetical protein
MYHFNLDWALHFIIILFFNPVPIYIMVSLLSLVLRAYGSFNNIYCVCKTDVLSITM